MTMSFRKRKGQSAIEYLTTYGWMLLVIAIVGGAIFTTIQGQSNLQSSSGLANADVQIANFGVTDKGLQIEFRSAAQEQVENIKVTVVKNSTANQSAQITQIPVGQTATATFSNFTQDQTQDTFEVVINYDTGGLTDLEVNGTIQGNLGYTG